MKEKAMFRYWLAGAAALALTAGAASAQNLPRTTVPSPPPSVIVVPTVQSPPTTFVAVAPPTAISVAPPVITAPTALEVPPGPATVTRTERTIDANGVQTDRVVTYERQESYGTNPGGLTTTTSTRTTGQALVMTPTLVTPPVIVTPGLTTTTQTTVTRIQQ